MTRSAGEVSLRMFSQEGGGLCIVGDLYALTCSVCELSGGGQVVTLELCERVHLHPHPHLYPMLTLQSNECLVVYSEDCIGFFS